MSDHALGILGLALAVVAIIAPYRWPQMHRILTDLGLATGTAIMMVAFQPNWQPYIGVASAPPQAAVETEAKASVQSKALAKEMTGLRSELAAAQETLKSAQEELAKTKKALALKDMIIAWGATPPKTFWMTINTEQLNQYKDLVKLMLIVRAQYSDVDRMTDTDIGKRRLIPLSQVHQHLGR